MASRTFNQDHSCISIGTATGYKIYNCDPFGKCYSGNDFAAGIVEMLYNTSLIAITGSGSTPTSSPRRLLIVNTKRSTTICELNFVSTVIAVRLNRKRLVCVLEESIHVYDIGNMKMLYSIDTSLNPLGVSDLSNTNGKTSYLAYPPTHQTGQILLFDTTSLQALTLIQAHKSPLAKLAFSQDSSMLASASVKGTVVRIFSVPEGKRLYQLRRGSSSAKISSITFSPEISGHLYVTVCSDSDTIHIYKVPAVASSGSTSATLPSASSATSASGIVSGAFSMVGSLGSMANNALSGYLPEFVNDFMDASRDFAFLKLPASSSSSADPATSAAISPGAASATKSPIAVSAAICGNHVLVICSDGYVLKYGFDPYGSGGECPLLKSHSLLEDDSVVETVQVHGSSSPLPSTTLPSDNSE